MALIIYGSPRSRTMRVLWAAAELGLSYEHRPIAWDDPQLKTAEFVRLNPAGAIPLIVDDGFALAESLAINLYLAKTYGPGLLYPTDPQPEALTWRWSLWAQGHLEPWVQLDAPFAELRAVPGGLSRYAEPALAILERQLAGRPWLVDDRFSIADLNVAGVLSPSRAASLDLSPHPHVRDWLARCYARPAAAETRRRFAA